ncbi:MAG: ABC transporter ATP-binding protein/permease [Pseudomonadota bacterium]|nr:ABC transporter ATP-binding protein/permease [Pseudomonadota bacterium]MDP1902960.1 ABC transporter ATP-binding protein/permease [Pseudomonadota bacterium]MDP2352268.1 ABC transporter ATP-binding protein/permease [Pseudomonadota bacterium]
MTPHTTAGQWRAAWSLAPYVWRYKGRVLAAFALLLCAKLANVSVPLVLKEIVDRVGQADAVTLAVPILFVVLYGLLRFGNTAFTELRDALFARVLQRAMRGAIHDVFKHLHAQSLRFHLERHTGGLAVDIERGARSIRFLINFTLFNIGPTLLEILMVAGVLFVKYDPRFGAITLLTLAVYLAFTIAITNWRLQYRRAMNESDSRANARAVDSLLNYETVKYFNNEQYESDRLKADLRRAEDATVQSEISLAWLNAGQAFIIAIGVTAMMGLAAQGVAEKHMTLGDLVLVNAYLIQLFIPLNFLGTIYREIRNALTDMEKLFGLLRRPPEIVDAEDARELVIDRGEVRFEQVGFAYDPRRPILEDISFVIPAGHKLAVVGASGVGKSTLSRLLFRFFEVGAGRILIDGQDIRAVTQASLRKQIGMVPQDTVLFNDSLYHNIAYGRPEATRAEVLEAARAASLDQFITSLPDGYDTVVGERGLKLSGGEKQRVAIARAILKNPPIMVFDEATSSLDTATEQAIGQELARIAENRTTLVIAHRLSTVVDADEILVLEGGRIVERGNHAALLAVDGRYAAMWRLQLRDAD